jgi:hypothetical protein
MSEIGSYSFSSFLPFALAYGVVHVAALSPTHFEVQRGKLPLSLM